MRQKLLNTRFLDPACGSGTFLVLIIARMRELGQKLFVPERELLEAILHNVVGFDLNPLAVLTARVNYLLAIADLLEYRRGDITIPVYLADSVRMPAAGTELFSQGTYEFPTAVGKFRIPAVLCTKERFDSFTNILAESIKSEIATDSFLRRIERELDLQPPEWNERMVDTLRELYEQMLNLHRQGLNSLWAQLLKNNFAPLAIGQFDYIVGNPPWVNWEHLPDRYREEIADLWRKMGAGGAMYLDKKWDISLLMTQIALTHFLKKGGKLGFVITQSAFKTNLGGRDFRKFKLPNGTPICVLHVDDMADLNPFEGASNRTAVMVLEKGKPTKYPVPYTVWRKHKGARFTYESTLEEVIKATRRLRFVAEPVDPRDPTSPWLTARPKALKAVRKVLGRSDYEAHAGAYTGGANGVYWVDIVYRRPDGLVVVRNLTEGAKVKVDEVTEAIEPDLLYPLLRGRDVKRWQAEPSAYILMTYLKQEGKLGIIPPETMESTYPRTLGYLKRFEGVLKKRSDYRHYFAPTGKPFYAMMPRPGTFAPWKVVWTRIAEIQAAVVGELEGKPIIPQETVTLVECETEKEAHYIAALVNSSPFQFAAVSYSQEGGKSMGSMHVLEHIRIPRYDASNPVHRRLAELSREAHEAAKVGDERRLQAIEEEIDQEAAKLWGLTDTELKEIQLSLRELGGEEREGDE